ncbi:8386_t:CDS:2, partial [Dentiscutata erythropus]
QRPTIIEVLKPLENLSDKKIDNFIINPIIVYGKPTIVGIPSNVKIKIFSFVTFPLNLILSCKGWYEISKDSKCKAEWLLKQFDRAHSLFHVIRLGPPFVNVCVVQEILKRGGLISRYFIQKLLLHYGKPRTEHNMENIRTKRNAVPWAIDTPLPVYTYILNDATNKYIYSEPWDSNNDMELFISLSGGQDILHTEETLIKNLELIKELISKLKFVPFPQRPNHKQPYDRNLDKYSSEDGYGNYREGAFLLLFPSESSDYVMPNEKKIIEKLQELLDLGFKLTNVTIIEILRFFGSKLSIIEKSPWKPERATTAVVLNFLYENIKNDAIFVFKSAMKYYTDERKEKRILNYKPLSFSLVYHNWVLGKFSEDSEIADILFEDILRARISIEQNQNSEISSNIHNEICNLYKVYCNSKNFFRVSHLKLFIQVNHSDILGPLFEYYLADLFNIKMPMKIINGENNYYKPKKRKRIKRNDREEWFNEIKNIYETILKNGNNAEITPVFKNFIEKIYCKLEDANSPSQKKNKSL